MKSNTSDQQVNPGEIWIVWKAIVYTLCKLKDDYLLICSQKEDFGQSAWKVLVLSSSRKFAGDSEVDSIIKIYINPNKGEHFLKISQEEFCNAIKSSNY